MNEDLQFPFDIAKKLIQNADVLLFHTHGGMFTVGWWIRKYTNSPYSHAGIACINNYGDPVCLEFREFEGSRAYPLKKYIEEGAKIDVFRAASYAKRPYIDCSIPYYPVVKYREYDFTDQVAGDIVDTCKKLLGQNYGWWNIWQMSKLYMPFIRLGQNINCKNGKVSEQEFVCSTLVAYSYRLHYIDPVPYVADSYTSPGDLARSGLFRKIFEII